MLSQWSTSVKMPMRSYKRCYSKGVFSEEIWPYGDTNQRQTYDDDDDGNEPEFFSEKTTQLVFHGTTSLCREITISRRTGVVCKEVPDEATTLSQVAQPGEMTSALYGMELRSWQ